MRLDSIRERRAPTAAGLVALAVGLAAGLSKDAVDSIVDDMVPLLITVASLLAGFQMTAQSLFLALNEAPIVVRLKKSGHYRRLIDFYWSSMRDLFRFIGVALVLYLLKLCEVELPWNRRVVPGVLAGLFTSAWFTSKRINWLMIKLLLNRDGEGLEFDRRDDR